VDVSRKLLFRNDSVALYRIVVAQINIALDGVASIVLHALAGVSLSHRNSPNARQLFKEFHVSQRVEIRKLSSLHSFQARWCSGERTWNENPATAVRIPGRATIPLGSNLGQVVYTHLPLQFLSSKKLGYKREFSAPKWLW